MPLARILQHEKNEGAGLLASALERAGFQVEARLRAVEPGDLEAPLVVVMGGPQAVYQASAHPYLLDELRLLRARLEARRPNLGVCLGAQLLAAAAGARVFPGERGVELGLLPLHLTGAGVRDEVFSALPATGFRALHWHGDTFDAVPGAEPLASTDRYPQQAFRAGRSYGVQFHPELTGAAFLEWADAAPEDLARAGVTREELEQVRSFPEGEPAIAALLDGLARFFAREAAAAATATARRP